MQSRYLKTLIMAVDTGSFSRAAEVLHITQSAASQRIKFLEEQFGHTLLDRSGPLLTPTEAGQLVIEKARFILAKEQELEEELKRLGGKKRLSLCCTPTFGMAYLPAVLNDFIRRNADMTDLKFIFQQPEQALRGLQENTFDLAILEHCDDCELPALRAFPLPEDELVVISAPALGLPESTIEVRDLLRHRLYARKDGCSSKQLLRQNLARHRRELDEFQSVVVSDDLRFTIQAVAGGGGISFVSRSLVDLQVKSGTLRASHVRNFDHFRRRSVLLHESRLGDSLLESFLQCVLAVLPKNPQNF